MCSISDSENTAEFILNDYKDCIISFPEAPDSPVKELTFYETIDEAELQINALDTSSYQNTTNPQIAFVLTKDSDTHISEITRIVLFAEPCDE
ncbi:hypothetical protein [Aquimarina sp. RZ0]|uniref:hypothetical protein n=1 Tax=Aquimarina sp. RZ0 TaxID=2607730 RepID=UPI0011F24DD7|nr:hypothetical protein [Aquimarina sp. RZ0]KAA1243120.1 hypothetical protein F0000_22430 [Aquimarina sp. RZ0]